MKNHSPQDHAPEDRPPCFVKFRVADLERFKLLAQAFEILKQEKLKYFAEISASEEAPENDSQERALQNIVASLHKLFDEQALAHFWWPSQQEVEDYWRRWFATPLPQRFTNPSLKTSWAFESMIRCFLDGEYELISCRLLTSDTGVLAFDPFSFPYGGTDCMKALIEAFDFQVIGEDNGTGYTACI